MSGMERSFTERLQAMGYSDKATFDRDVERSERELLAWQEIFKMLQDTYGRLSASFRNCIQSIALKMQIYVGLVPKRIT
jgi:hypothetical protein